MKKICYVLQTFPKFLVICDFHPDPQAPTSIRIRLKIGFDFIEINSFDENQSLRTACVNTGPYK